MENLELRLASKDANLSVRTFSVVEEMSHPFDISIVARSPDEDLDLDSLVGQGAGFKVATALAWTGIIGYAEQIDVDTDGLSTYFLRIVPPLSRTLHRRNNRIFQHLSVPEIAQKLLGEWEIEPALELDMGQFPKLEYRVQYGESDFGFLHRMLEEAGISYYFRPPDPGSESTSTLVLCADPTAREARPAIDYVNNLEFAKGREVVTHVKIAHQARSGRFTVRDHDFRTRPDFQLIAEAKAALAAEERYEQYHYDPGAFVVDPGRVDEREAKAIAQRRLAGARQGRRKVTLRTTALDLAPGHVFCIDKHPRSDLARDKRLLVVERTLEGTSEGEWTSSLTAVFAAEPYRPIVMTPKPRMGGLQSAIVVGPAGEEIHTDEHGRVRVQFHWDREGKYTDDSSCWIRVSQGWAGRGFGSVAIPRVGQEVLVDFLEGDPDQPLIVGRVYNGTSPLPYKLPENKTKSTWKSDSSPGSGGFNEITFDDAAGREKVFMHAQKDLEEIVRERRSVQVGKALETRIGEAETRNVAADQTLEVGGNRVARVDGTDVLVVGQECRIQVGQVGASLSTDRVVFSTGKASITLAGGDIFLDASGAIRVSSSAAMNLSGQAVSIDGAPNVMLNSASAAAPAPVALSAQDLELPNISLPDITTSIQKALAAPIFDELPGGFDEAKLEGAIKNLIATPPVSVEDAPSFLMMPQGIEQQIEAEIQKIIDTPVMVVNTILDKVALEQKKIEDKIAEVRDRAGEIAGDVRKKIVGAVEDLRARAEAGKQLAIAKFNEIRGRLEAARDQVKAKVEELRGKLEEAKARAVAMVEQFKSRLEAAKAQVMGKVEEIKDRYEDAKARVVAKIDEIKGRYEDAKARVVAKIDEIKGRIEAVKEQAKAKIDEIKGRIQSIKDQAKATIDEMKERVLSLKQQAVERFEEMKKQAGEIIEMAKSQLEAAKARVQELKAQIEGAKEQVKQKWQELKGKVEEIKAQAKAKVEEVKAQARQVVENVKQTIESAKEEAKQVLGDAKHLVEDVKGQAKEVWGEAKGAWNQTKDEAKAAWNDLKHEAKDTWNQTKAEAKGMAHEAKDMWNQSKAEAKDAWKQAKSDVKEMGQEAKDAWKQTKDEAKDAWKQAKDEAKDAWKQTKDEAKDAWSQAKADAKEMGHEAKDAWNDVKQEAKQDWKDLGHELKDGWNDVKSGASSAQSGPGALGSVKDALGGANGQAPGGLNLGAGAQYLQGHASIGGGGSAAQDAGGAMGQIYSRAGGFTGQDVASAVNGAKGATVFQSPGEGQLFVVKTQAALPLDGKEVSAHLVDAQMSGVHTTDAFIESLSQKGYVVYERPWGALGEAFVKRAVL
jgi:type VI secretion system secreted protein VgrG